LDETSLSTKVFKYNIKEIYQRNKKLEERCELISKKDEKFIASYQQKDGSIRLFHNLCRGYCQTADLCERDFFRIRENLKERLQSLNDEKKQSKKSNVKVIELN
jgi:hypothetical protein